jgi:hypothetical protein
MSIERNGKLPESTSEPKHEYKMPVIVCPICGDKDHISLTAYDLEVDNNLQEGHFRDCIYTYSRSMTHKHNINGYCTKCGSSFNFSISATVPRDKPVISKWPR